ncbi:unnamed protein product, partial [Durusdinium trenchii]
RRLAEKDRVLLQSGVRGRRRLKRSRPWTQVWKDSEGVRCRCGVPAAVWIRVSAHAAALPASRLWRPALAPAAPAVRSAHAGADEPDESDEHVLWARHDHPPDVSASAPRGGAHRSSKERKAQKNRHGRREGRTSGSQREATSQGEECQ